MTEYRIVEAYRKIWIEKKLMSDTWIKVDIKDVPKYHDTVADARSWVATIKRGVVYHDAEDAPNLAQDERKAEDDTSDGIKPLEWFLGRVGKVIMNDMGYHVVIIDRKHAEGLYHVQEEGFYRYSDTPTAR
jgi:hypothetical protein